MRPLDAILLLRADEQTAGPGRDIPRQDNGGREAARRGGLTQRLTAAQRRGRRREETRARLEARR